MIFWAEVLVTICYGGLCMAISYRAGWYARHEGRGLPIGFARPFGSARFAFARYRVFYVIEFWPWRGVHVESMCNCEPPSEVPCVECGAGT